MLSWLVITQLAQGGGEKADTFSLFSLPEKRRNNTRAQLGQSSVQGGKKEVRASFSHMGRSVAPHCARRTPVHTEGLMQRPPSRGLQLPLHVLQCADNPVNKPVDGFYHLPFPSCSVFILDWHTDAHLIPNGHTPPDTINGLINLYV